MFPLTATYYDAEQKIWFGPQRKDFYHETMTLGEATILEYSKHPQKVIQINDTTNERMTSQEFIEYVTAFSNNLLRLGLTEGDVVGMFAQNCTHTATVIVGSYLCGTPVNALFPGFDKDTVQYIYKVTMPKIIFCDVENYEIALAVCQNLRIQIPIFLMNGKIEGVSSVLSLIKPAASHKSQTFAFPCVNLRGDDTAVILCSSGTTGTPKGVLCSHRALLNQNVYLNLNSDSVVCTFSTMYWASGLWNLNASLLNCCLRIVVNKPYTPEYLLELVERHKITHMVVGGPQMAEFLTHDNESEIRRCLASIDSFVVGGSKVPLIVQQKMARILKEDNEKRPGFGVAYGMSELSGMLSYNASYIYDNKEGSEGKLTANKKVRIVGKNGEFLGPNEHGEIIISTPYTWFGYYRNEEASKKAYIDGWLYTGDIGFFDDDGFLYVCARNNDVFKAKNFQIYPQLLENVVLQLPGVLEACVFGIPDLVATNLIACAVVRKDDPIGYELTSDEIISHVQSTMGSMYHLSGGVYFVDVMPKTASGKIQRGKILELVQPLRKVQ